MSRSEDREYRKMLERSRGVVAYANDPHVLEAQQVADTARENLETAARNCVNILGVEKTGAILEPFIARKQGVVT